MLAADPNAKPISLWERDRLTGDWAGWRTKMEEHGFTLEFDSSHFYQGLISGDGDHDWEYGGRLDAYVHLDSGKLGLWEGGGLHSHVGFSYGNLSENLGGTIVPNNLGLTLPLGAREEVHATSIFLTQKFGDAVTASLGKIDTADLPGGDPFFGGYGVKRFMHLAFAAPANGLLPPAIIGGIVSVAAEPFTFTVMAYDPNDRTTEYWPDDLFDDGVNLSLSGRWSGRLADRSTSVILMGIYSTEDSIDLSDVLLPPDLRTGLAEDSWHASVQFSHFLHEKSGQPGQGLNFSVKIGLSDGNPNPFQSWITGGLIGKGLVPGRPRDQFGAGYFFYDFSEDLKNALNPSVEFNDEQGFEAFYSFAVTPWFHLTTDLQVVDPATGANKTAVIGGVRGSVRF